jgi:uncharacterized protein
MDEILIGEKLQIQCYKHNGKIHRAWDEAVVIDIKDDYIVCGNNKTIVIESEGNVWKTKEPAIMYFFKKKWFNIIVQLKKDGIYFYCNIASPYLIEEKTIKYIDYDLDLRVFPDGEYKILDKMEYKYHKKIMNYSDDLDHIIHKSMEELIKCYENKHEMFDKDQNYRYHEKYKTIRNA